MDNIKLLSLVVPAYRQEKTIVKDIKTLENTLESLQIPFEIIVVVDGLVDKTFQKVKKLKSRTVNVITYKENQGKGHAVRNGMLQAKGDIIGFMDSGMDIDPTGISMLLNHMIWYDADIVVGSKLHPVSQVYYPPVRKVMSWGYRTFTRILFGFRVRDTQVGLKFFKRKVVHDVFPLLAVKRFAFDIEILAVAYRLGYTRIYEAPIKLDFRGMSSINSTSFWSVIFDMIWDTCAVYYRIKILNYYDKLRKQKQ